MLTIRGYSYCTQPAYSGSIGEPVFSAEDTAEPVTLAEAKQYLRIDAAETAFDAEITELITATRQEIETYLNRSLINRAVTVTMSIANGIAALPYAPVKELSAVTDIDSIAVEVGNYTLKGDVLKTGSYYQLTLTYAAGYGNTLPPAFKIGIKKLLAFDYEHKGDDGTKRIIGDITGLRKYRRVV